MGGTGETTTTKNEGILFKRLHTGHDVKPSKENNFLPRHNKLLFLSGKV